MNEIRALLEDTVERLFSDGVDKELIMAAENGAWPTDLWNAVEQSGLTRPHLSEEAGGAGGGWSEAFVIARAGGRHSVPLPLGETLLASWLLSAAGLEIPEGPLTVIPEPADGMAKRVPWARHTEHAVLVAADTGGTRVALVRARSNVARQGCNLALEPRDDLLLDGTAVAGPAPAALPAGIVWLYGAMIRAAQMAGALDALLEMSVQYAGERVQFGRPIGKFQAIQQELAKLAGYAAASATAAEVAFGAADDARAGFDGVVGAPGDPAFEIAAAKVIVGEAAELGPRIAHQVHGAIGFTYEHGLHFATRRLWSWRAEFGSATHWARALGRHAFEIGAGGLWPFVTSR